MILVGVVLFFPGFSLASGGENDSIPLNGYRNLGVLVSAGTIFVHSEDVENTSGSRPVAMELEFSKKLLGEKAWLNCHCYPTRGILFGFTDYNNRILGYGLHLAWFLEYPFFPMSGVTPVIRGAVGLSYSNRPWHPEHNPTNQSYSLPVNAFLQLQFGIDARIGSGGRLTLRIGYNHISNGGIRLPNKGINWPTLSVGYSHAFGYFDPPRRSKIPMESHEKRWLRRIELFSTLSTREMETSRVLWIYGGMFTMARKVSRIHTFSAAAEWHYSELLLHEINKSALPASAHRAALLAGHDFLLGRFIFSQQIGVYIFDQFRYNDPVYHRWTLSYVHKTGLSAGVSLKAHRQVAEFTDVRIGWQW
jgi:hypothetical protein